MIFVSLQFALGISSLYIYLIWSSENFVCSENPFIFSLKNKRL